MNHSCNTFEIYVRNYTVNNTKSLKYIVMKNLKSAMIAMLLVCTLVSLATAGNFETRKVVSITFERAIQNPGLVAAMFQQLDSGFLNNIQHYYIMRVTYEGNIYEITGTYDQWVRFFESKWKFPAVTEKPKTYH
jgi:hypothetical protein